ncbi:hypothetical protein BU15DRAFT_74082 [Melanogaster broomeanus]|nr:hypothetical protein BU15DRAFT_74082 [Melanogaster broomeanus]
MTRKHQCNCTLRFKFLLPLDEVTQAIPTLAPRQPRDVDQQASTYTGIPAVVGPALLALPNQSAESVLAAHGNSPLWRRSISRSSSDPPRCAPSPHVRTVRVHLHVQRQGLWMEWDEGVFVVDKKWDRTKDLSTNKGCDRCRSLTMTTTYVRSPSRFVDIALNEAHSLGAMKAAWISVCPTAALAALV